MNLGVLFLGLVDQACFAGAIEEGVGHCVDGGRVPASPLKTEFHSVVGKTVLEFDAREPFLSAGEDNLAVLHEARCGILVQRANSEYSHDALVPVSSRLRSPWPV